MKRSSHLLISCVVLILTGLYAISTPAGATTTIPQSTTVAGLPAVGALFTLTKAGKLGTHFCTASVVDSPAGDLILTAAHCIAGKSPNNVVFVPEYHDDEAPLGIWSITKFVVDQAWSTSQNPNDDFAFLVVHESATGLAIQNVTGGEQLGIDLPADGLLTAVGYPDTRNSPISCQSALRLASKTQLQFDCSGYTTGTSGSAMVVDVDSTTGLGTVVGVIGGYELGGYTPSVSYAARFEQQTSVLYAIAIT